MATYFRWKFSALFLWLLVMVLVHPFVMTDTGGNMLFVIVTSCFFLAVILTLCEHPWVRRLAIVLGVLAIVGRWTDLLLEGPKPFSLEVLDRVGQFLLLTCTVVVLTVAIFKRRTVTLDSILGAFGGYLLIAYAWAILFALVDLYLPGAFHVADSFQQQWKTPVQRDWLLAYFSCCTMMTVGYGDITPVHPVARTLSVLEAMAGQCYLAVLVAVLVGVKVAQVNGPTNDSGEEVKNNPV